MITKSINASMRVALLLAVVFGTGCQMLPMENLGKLGGFGKSSDDETATADMPAGEDGAEQQEVRTPNPYLSGRSSAPREAMSRFESAKDAMANKQWDKAQADLEWVIANYSTLSGPYLNLALVFRATDKPEKAETAFQQAILANNNNVNAHNQYGIFLREQGRFTEAQTSYENALKVWPDHPDSHRNLGILLDLFMGKPEQALPYYKRYQSLLDQPDRKIAGWIADTERRVKQQAAANTQ